MLVDGILGVEWTVHARSTVTAAKVWSAKILAIHNGTATADASDVDYNTFSVLKMGGNISQLDFEVDVSGTGAAQVLRLRASSGEAVNIRITRGVLNEQ